MNEFDKAKQDILTYGHNKGDYFESGRTPHENMMDVHDETPSCLMGAMSRANHMSLKEIYDSRAYPVLLEVVREQYPDRHTGWTNEVNIPHFNDHPKTTLDEVISVLEKASVLLDEQV